MYMYHNDHQPYNSPPTFWSSLLKTGATDPGPQMKKRPELSRNQKKKKNVLSSKMSLFSSQYIEMYMWIFDSNVYIVDE